MGTDLAGMERLLRPRSFALVGASAREHSAGRRILRNLLTGGFPGKLYPINPRYEELEGLKCWPSLESLPEVPDSVFIAIPSDQVTDVVDQAGRLGVKAAMVNATGFADAGGEGVERQRRLVEVAARHGMAMCGPNNSGFINLWDKVFPSTYYTMPRPEPGPVGVVTQSGSVGIALSQDDRRLGLGYIVTCGNEAVCGAADYLRFMAADPRIRVVMMFLEVLRDPAAFAAAADEAAARGTRVVAVKVGRSEGGRAAVSAHSGALAGDDKVYDAFFRAHGVVRAADLDEMVEIASLFSAYPEPPAVPAVVPVTLSGGEAGLISDMAAEAGLPLPQFAPDTAEKLRPFLSPYFPPRNPLDAMGLGWDRQRFANILTTLFADPAVGTVAIAADASASGLGDFELVTDMAEVSAAQPVPEGRRIVFFTNTSPGGPHPKVESILKAAGIPILCGLRPSVAAMARWSDWRPPAPRPAGKAPAAALVARLAQPGALGEAERFRLMAEAGVPMAACEAVADEAAAVAAAARLGWPVVLKGTAPDLLHKTEHGLVRVGLHDEGALRAAYRDVAAVLHRHSRSPAAEIVVQPMVQGGVELILGLRNDPGFGPVVVVGLGGTFVELLKEASVRLAPVDEAEAEAMLREIRAGAVLDGLRGRGPYDIKAAARAVARLSEVGAALQDHLAAIEINPLIVREEGAAGVDVLLEPKG